ncbi:hypothetical protein B9J78_04895 [bacterium Unc6]|nr:hypothetical protein [bacterium Unc6]
MKNIIVILVTVLCLAFLGITVYFSIQKKKLQEKWSATQEEVKKITGEKTSVEKNLAGKIQEKVRIIGLYEEKTKEVNKLQSDLNMEERTRQKVESKLSDVESRLAITDNQLEQAKKENITLNKQVSKVSADAEKAKAELNKERIAKEEAMLQLAEIKIAKENFEKRIRQVVGEIGQMRGTPSVTDEGDIIVKTIEGQVLAVSREYNVVVLDIGMVQGLRLGEVLTVLRNNQIIAKVQIEKIRENSSAAALLSEFKKATVRVGDKVKVSKVL